MRSTPSSAQMSKDLHRVSITPWTSPLAGNKIYWTEQTGESSWHDQQCQSQRLRCEGTERKSRQSRWELLWIPREDKLYWTNSRGRIQSVRTLTVQVLKTYCKTYQVSNDIAVARREPCLLDTIQYGTAGTGSVGIANTTGRRDTKVISRQVVTIASGSLADRIMAIKSTGRR